ncbi:hypothetical protein L226DRAFT_598924, partial [Lentinus tigrinus ALCF2SS1-7]
VERQITTYVESALHYQHRAAMFFLLVHGNRLRVTRWDRSGISTESFKYTSERARLRDVLWDFSRLDAGQQGFDTTAILLTPDSNEYKLMDDLKVDHAGTDLSEAEGTIVTKAQEHYTFRFAREAFAQSIAKGFPRYRLTVPAGNEERRFLVGEPTVTVAPGITGRGTRGFVAWDVAGRRFTFLKDAWRHHLQKVSTEGQALRDLHSAGVENTPTCVCDAELQDMTKIREALADEPAVEDFKHEKNVSKFRHYRIVVEEVCLPLKRFTTGKQLISIMRDCVKAHEGAATKAKIMHCDISNWNILICPRVEPDEKGVLRVKWRGILVDWELSNPIVSEDNAATAPPVVRAGTFMFSSAHILDNPEQPFRIADELESIFHVTLYNALRHLR